MSPSRRRPWAAPLARSALVALLVAGVTGACGLEAPPDAAAGSVSPVPKGSPALPAVSEPVLAAEATYSPRSGGFTGPLVATDGSSYLAVLASRFDLPLETVRIAADGTVDVVPTVVAQGECGRASVVWSGSSYVLICHDSEVDAYRLRADGTLIDQVQLLEAGDRWGFKTAYGGGHHLLVWDEDEVIWGFLVRDDGDTLEPVTESPFVIGEGPGRRDNATVAWLGSAFFVAYTDNRFTDVPSDDIRGTLIGTDAVVENTDGNELIADATLFERPLSLIAGGPGALLIYERTFNEIRSVMVDSSGTLFPASDRSHYGDYRGGPTQGTWTGDRWILAGPTSFNPIVVWPDPAIDYELYPRTVRTDDGAKIAWRGDEGLLLGFDGGLLQAQRIDVDGPVGDPAYVATRGNPFLTPTIQSDGTGYVAFYGILADRYAQPLDLRGQRIGELQTRRGSELEARVVPIGTDSYLIGSTTSGSGRSIAFRRLRTKTGYEPLFDSPSYSWSLDGCCGFDVASSNLGHILATPSSGLRTNDRGPAVARLQPDGSELDDSLVRLSISRARVQEVSAAGLSDRYLVAFKRVALDDSLAGLYATRVIHEDLEVLDRNAIELALEPDVPRGAKVVAVDDAWVIAWSDTGGMGFATIGQDGAFLREPYRVSTSLGPAESGVRAEEILAAFGGRHVLLVWPREVEPDGQVVATGVVIDPESDGFPKFHVSLFDDDGLRNVSGVASVGGDQFIVIYTRFDPEVNAEQLYTRVISLSTPLGSECQTAADCGVSPCVDGVCCNTACGDSSLDDCQACATDAGGAFDGVCTARPADSLCRSAFGVCDAEERCDGDALQCPQDLPVSDGFPCDDANVCNGVSTCQAGVCVDALPLSCDDSNVCTTDACDPFTGCGHSPVVCEDTNPCTVDGCSPSLGCVFLPLDCGDGDACTVDSCDLVAGCVNLPLSCVDEDPCTVDACDSATGCTFEPVDCSDADACTADACDSATGDCSSTPIDCDDGNDCTVDGCDAATGCTNVAVDCDDGDACTADSCDRDEGCLNVAIDCDDGDPCTTDACDASTGCTNVADPDCDADPTPPADPDPNPSDPTPDPMNDDGGDSGCSVGPLRPDAERFNAVLVLLVVGLLRFSRRSNA